MSALRRSLAISAIIGWWMLAMPASVHADVITLRQACMSSTGGAMSGLAMAAVSVAGESPAGDSTTTAVTLKAGYTLATTPLPPGSRTIDVSGTLNEPVSNVTVNAIPATLTDTMFVAHNVPIVEGPNTITALATDLAGNIGTHNITVYLDTHPPAMPTTTTHLTVITANNYQLCGTKTAQTSLWINGAQAVPLDNATSWCVTLSAIEGDNNFTIVAKDAAGNASASTVSNLLVDNLPPVVSNIQYFDSQGAPLNLDPATHLPKTNFATATITGTVDDSLTVVTVNGLTATRSAQNFQVQVPLALGSNALTLIATSPNNHVTQQPLTVARGQLPIITGIAPPDGSKSYADTTVTIQGSATDPDNDPLEFQLSIDGQVVTPWSSASSTTWTPSTTVIGIHPIRVEVRDNFGGAPLQDVEAYVVHQPIAPPQ